MKKSLIPLLILICFTAKSQQKAVRDSVSIYLKLANSAHDPLKLHYLNKAEQFADVSNNDNLKLKVKRALSFVYFDNELYDDYLDINRKCLKLAHNLKDTTTYKIVAKNLGSYYGYIEKNDSSYHYYSLLYKACKPDEVSRIKVETLLNLADLQQLGKAYYGAEIDAVNGIKILNKLPENEKHLELSWSLTNLLGIISENTFNKKKALEYYDKSLDISKKMNDGFLYEIFTLNNIANVFRSNKEYQRAITIYTDLLKLKDKFIDEEPDFYPALLLNLSKTKYDSKNYSFSKIEKDLRLAFQLYKEVDYKHGEMATSIELSRLYNKHGNKDEAIKYAQNTLQISKTIKNNEYKMEALKSLSELFDAKTSNKYLRDYINLSDSLKIIEQATKNKFARVKFETDTIKAQNKKISKENIYLLVITIGLILTLILVYVVVSQRLKNNKLTVLQERQKSNEKVYNLMLQHQDKIEEARSNEKHKISKELHDGILSRLFGARLSLDSLNFQNTEEVMGLRVKYINELKSVEGDIRKISHQLNFDSFMESSFKDLIANLISTQTQTLGLSYVFNCSDDITWDVVALSTKINIYRVLQESIQNIIKHADATILNISIFRVDNFINIKIVDDGKGFDTSKSNNGIGIKNMTTRIKEEYGKFFISSEINAGTQIKIQIPYKTIV